MNAQELIDMLNSQGLTLMWHDKKIIWKGPSDFVLSNEITKLVKKNWDEIVKRIEGPLPKWLIQGTKVMHLFEGDCLRRMNEMPTNLVDVIVTDPPYGLKFMKKDWDIAIPSVQIWKECLRVLKPGGFAFIMSSSRQDVLARMILSLEEAGFNTGFTSLYWTYASGFPKAHNISKAIDKKAGVNRTELCRNPNSREDCDKSSTICQSGTVGETAYITEPATPEAKALDGSYGGYQPKPAVEVILIVQKPLSEKTYADQALVNGKGATWLDDCRIPFADSSDKAGYDYNRRGPSERLKRDWESPYEGGWKKPETGKTPQGRFPANLLISDDVLDDRKSHAGGYSRYFSLDAWVARNLPFLIVPKASMREKNFGLETIDSHCLGEKGNGLNRICEKCGAPQLKPCDCEPKSWVQPKRRNHHPTVKPIQLMSYLITIGSREGEIVLDPFCGSGTTCLAARLLKRPCIGIEKDPGYFKLAASKMRALNLLSHIGHEQQKKSGTKKKKG